MTCPHDYSGTRSRDGYHYRVCDRCGHEESTPMEAPRPDGFRSVRAALAWAHATMGRLGACASPSGAAEDYAALGCRVSGGVGSTRDAGIGGAGYVTRHLGCDGADAVLLLEWAVFADRDGFWSATATRLGYDEDDEAREQRAGKYVALLVSGAKRRLTEAGMLVRDDGRKRYDTWMEIAKRLGVEERRAMRWAGLDDGPPVKRMPGGMVIAWEDEIVAWEDSRPSLRASGSDVT